jgi:hypothetical protein
VLRARVNSEERRSDDMTWIQLGTLVVANFVSVLFAIWIFRWVDYRKKKKFIDGFLDQMQEKISTEMNFQDLVKRLEDEDR